MKDAAAETDIAKRAALLAQAEALVAREHPFVGLLFYSNRNLISPKVEGFIPNLRGANPTRFVSLKP
jgi:oligopeptide transport system substrate-binding protein